MTKINFLNRFYFISITLLLFFHTFGQQMVKFETFEIKMSQGGWNIGFGAPQTLINGTNSYSLQMGTAFAGFNSAIPMQSLNGNSQTNSYYFSSGATTPYNPVLSSNTGGLVEWYMQIKSGQTNVQPGGNVSGRQGMGVVLASSVNSNSYTAGNRYALVYGDAAGAAGNGKLQLVAIADGSDYTQSTVICSTSGTLSSFTGGNSHDHFSVKVSYNPTNNEWSLFVRNDGNAFKGPFHQTSYHIHYYSARTTNNYTRTERLACITAQPFHHNSNGQGKCRLTNCDQ